MMIPRREPSRVHTPTTISPRYPGALGTKATETLRLVFGPSCNCPILVSARGGCEDGHVQTNFSCSEPAPDWPVLSALPTEQARGKKFSHVTHKQHSNPEQAKLPSSNCPLLHALRLPQPPVAFIDSRKKKWQRSTFPERAWPSA